MMRRGDNLLTWLVGGLTIVFVLVPLGPALLGRGTLLDVGALSGMLPFRAQVGAKWSSTVVCRMDTIDYYLPGIAEIKRSFFAGHFPTWAPYEVGGAPLASLPNHGALSPMSLPYFVMPLWLAPAYVKLLEFVVAIGGMVLFLRRLGLSRVSGLVAGVVFAGSGFMIMWSNWPHTRVAALIPALFWALERVLQQRRARDVVVVGVVVASMLLGGFPAIVLFALTLAAPYVVVRALVIYRDRRGFAVGAVLATGVGIAVGIGLSAIQILPFVSNLSSQDLLAERDKGGVHLPFYTAITIIDPYALGTCVGGEKLTPSNPIEAIGFIGGVAIMLAAAALALARSPAADSAPTRFLTGAAIVLGVAIWVGGPVLALLRVLPLWSTNGIGRAQSVFGFVVAVLVGVGFDRLHRVIAKSDRKPVGDRPEPLLIVRLTVVLAALVAVFVPVVRAALEIAGLREFTDRLQAGLMITGLIQLLGVTALLAAAVGPRAVRTGALALLAVLLVVPSTAFAHTLLPPSRVADFYPTTPTHTYLSTHLEGERFGGRGKTMLAPTADFYRLRTPVGHEFTDQRWKDLLAAADPSALRTITYSSFSPSLTVDEMARSPILDQQAVRYWVDSPRRTVGDRDRLPDSGDGEVTLETGGEAACTVPGGPMRGVRVVVATDMPPAPEGRRPMVHLSVTSGGVERRGSVLIDSAMAAGNLFIAVAGEDLPADRRATVSVWLTDTDGSRVFRGEGKRIDCAAVRPADDGLSLVHADAGAAVYQRLGALPRIRWASTSRVVEDGQARVAALDRGVPTGTVLLEDAGLPTAQGRPAEVRVLEDAPEHIRVAVEAKGRGYLVVADSIVRPGWRATVDGKAVPVVHGNHAFAAIPVPEGEHVVALEYVAPGLALGVAVTVGSLLLSAAAVLVPTSARRRRRRTAQTDRHELP